METLYRAGLSNAVSATVLAVVVACVGRLIGRRPAVMHCLWLVVLLKLITPPLYEVPVPWPKAPAAIQPPASLPEAHLVDRRIETAGSANSAEVVIELIATSLVSSENHPIPPARAAVVISPSIDWLRLACLIWLGGTVTTLVVSIARIRRFQRLLVESRPVEEDTQAWVDDLAASLGLNRSPSVWWTEAKLPPLVWSLGPRARMIIPRALWNDLGEQERSTLIIHELAHLRRGDHLVRIFELLVTALYWWHPVLWWARLALRDVEEQCCDAWVVWSCPGAAKSYAETLLETLDFLNQSDLAEPLLASGFGRPHHLRKRLIMIMSGNTPRLLGLWGTLGSLGLGALLLPVNVSWAQKAEDQAEVKVVVKTDDDARETITVLTDASITATAVADAAKMIEDSKLGSILIEVKTDDPSTVIVGGPIDDAIKKIKDQIAEIDKEAKPSDAVVARKKTLERVVKELETISRKVKQVKVDMPKLKAEKDLKEIVLRKVELDKKMSPETKAEIDKTAAEVKKLAEELRVKQKELSDARNRLARLSMGKLRPAALTIKGDGRTKDQAPLAKKPVDRVERHTDVRRNDESGQKRIDELEKKLEKLLEEVASLKKDRAK